MANKDLKVLSSRLKSLKGWLSRTISACDNLVSAPRSLASDSFLKSTVSKDLLKYPKILLFAHYLLKIGKEIELQLFKKWFGVFA